MVKINKIVCAELKIFLVEEKLVYFITQHFKIVSFNSSQKLNERDRTELERLWYLYCCCVCILGKSKLTSQN